MRDIHEANYPPRFELGDIVVTEGVMKSISPQEIAVGIGLHARCEWG